MITFLLRKMMSSTYISSDFIKIVTLIGIVLDICLIYNLQEGSPLAILAACAVAGAALCRYIVRPVVQKITREKIKKTADQAVAFFRNELGGQVPLKIIITCDCVEAIGRNRASTYDFNSHGLAPLSVKPFFPYQGPYFEPEDWDWLTSRFQFSPNDHYYYLDYYPVGLFALAISEQMPKQHYVAQIDWTSLNGGRTLRNRKRLKRVVLQKLTSN